MAKAPSFAERLKKMDKVWEQSTEAAGGGGFGPNVNVENGKHEGARLVEAKLVDVSNGTKMMIEWVFDCLDAGSPAERSADPNFGIISSRDGLDTPQNLGHMKRKLKYFGFDPNAVKAAELEDALAMITKGHPLCDIRTWISQDGQWQNHQLLGNGPVGWEEDPWGEPAAEEAVDDLEGLDRQGLLKVIAAEKLNANGDCKVFKTDSDAAIAEKIRTARKILAPAVEEEAPVEEEEVPVEEEEILAEEPSIVVGSQVLYTPPKSKKAYACEVTDIDAAGTAKLKNNESGKLLAGRVALDQLELAKTEEEAPAEEELPAEEFGTITKGSKVEVAISGKTYKGVVDVDPASDATVVKVKLEDGPFKGKVKDIPVDDVEPLE